MPSRKVSSPNNAASAAALVDKISENIEQVVQGKQDRIRLALVCMLAHGHLLLEDVPGVGKTLLAKSLARTIGCAWRRIQFTPDLLPTDITGVTIYNQERRDFEFKPGAIFANVVLGDEVNRASPKTQSALLEAMEEVQVTMDGVTYPLPEPFLVMATQNPVEHEGTYPLPAAQLDRFLMKITLGYPSHEAEMEVLHAHGAHSALEEIGAVTDARSMLALMQAATRVHVAESLNGYIVDLVSSTRNTTELSLGASPRASLALLRASRAYALTEGRDFVVPDDIKLLAIPVLAHRVIAAPEAEMSGRSSADVLEDLIEEIPVPIRG
ncbi:MAG: AAA family ATPase [Actinomycetota bacterium]